MFERLAKDPTVPVEKLEKLIQLQERIMAFNAKRAFDTAFAEMQADIPAIDKNGKIVVRDQLRSRYARNEDIQDAVKPILKRYGFGLSFRTEWPTVDRIRIIGILGHRDGHTRESTFEAAADHSGEKNENQARGSTLSYGHRYTTVDLLNVTQRGVDTDAASSTRSRAAVPHAPATRQPDGPLPITDAQRKRLWVLIKKSGRTETEVKMWLKVRYGYDSTREIARSNYDDVCRAVESSAALPLPEDREPGEEG